MRDRTGTSYGEAISQAVCEHRTEDLILLQELIEAGQVNSVMDRSYPLEQAAEAHRHIENGH